jgi:peptidyl-prolyl cis-trans isomerase A (cyclophilin A)
MFDWNTIYRLQSALSRFALGLGIVLIMGMPRTVDAGTIVNFSSDLGDFSVELFDDITPITVANFLGYVTSGRYDNLLIHRNVPGIVVQAGLATIDRDSGVLTFVPTDPTIVNEFSVSNTRGTIAMAKLGGDPNSASKEWFINVGSNSSNLDFQNGGFTAFGRVLGSGMEVVDAINDLDTRNITLATLGLNTDLPLMNFIDGTAITFDNLVSISVSIAPPPAVTVAPNYFDAASGLLNMTVDAGASGLATLSFEVVATEPEAIIKALLNTVEPLTNTTDKMATFDEVTGQLILPELVIDGAVAFRNLVFTLIDADQLLFTLVSFEQ